MSQEKLITLDNLGTFKDKLDVRVNRMVSFNNQNLADNPDITVTGSTKVQIASFDATKFDSLPSTIYFKIVTDRYKEIDIAINYKDAPGPTSRVEVYPDGVNTFTISNTNDNLASCIIEADAGTYSNMMFCVNQNATYVPYYHSNRQLTHEVEDLNVKVSNLQTTTSKNGTKNLLPITLEGVKALNTTGTWNGNAYTKSGVTFTVNTDSNGNVTGISTSGSNISTTSILYFKLATFISDGTNYILSGCPVNGSTNTYSMFIEFTQARFDTGSGVDFNDVGNGNIFIRIAVGANVSNKTFYPMIRLASDTDSTFQPYTKTNLQLTNEVKGLIDTAAYNGAKNLLPMTLEGIKALNTTGTWSDNEYTLNNIVYTVNTDKNGNVIGITTSGTASANSNLKFILGDLSFLSGCIMTGCPQGGTTETYRIRFSENFGSYTQLATDTGNGATLPNNITTNDCLCYIAITSGVNMTGKTFYPMIRLASDTDPIFQPYSKTNLELTDDVRDINNLLIDNACPNIFGFNITAFDKTATYKPNTNQRLVITSYDTNNITFRFNGGNYSTAHLEIEGIDGTLPNWNNYITYEITDNNTTYNPIVVVDTVNSTSEKLVIVVSARNQATTVGSDKHFTVSNLMVTRFVKSSYVPYYPSNKELASLLKSKSVSATTDANGIIGLSGVQLKCVYMEVANYIAIPYTVSSGTYCKILSPATMTPPSQGTSIEGTLYFYN